jgi:hypothetical protein
MPNELNNIEDLFKDKLNSFEIQGESNWGAVLHATNKRLFFRFIPQRFNIYYLSAAIMAAGSLFFLLSTAFPTNTTTQSPTVIESPALPHTDTIAPSSPETPTKSHANEGFSLNQTDKKIEKRASSSEKTMQPTKNDLKALPDVDNHIQSVVKDSILRKTDNMVAVRPESPIQSEIKEPINVSESEEKDTIVIESKEIKVIEKTVKRKR